MIKSFYTIGKVLSQDEEYAEYFEPWASPFPKIKDDGGVVVFAEVENGKLKEELTTEDFKKKLVDSYLYRKVQGANGTNLVPTLLLQMESNFDKYADNVRKLIKKVKQSILNNKHTFINTSQIDTIEQKLIALHGFMSNDKRYLFSMKIDNKYFGDFEEYKELFREEAYRKYYKDSKSNNKVCSITYQKSDEVWGRVDTLGFTVDAVTFSRNGFDVSESYKMFPVSPEAVKILEGAKRIIIDSDLNLTRNFYGLKYFILPHFVGANDEIINEIITSFINKSATNSLESEGKGIIGNETIINEIISDENLSRDDIYYDIFFYQPNNAQFLIKLHLSDVLPSRFSEIFRAKKRIEEKYKVLNRIIVKAKNSKSNDIIKEFKINFGGFYEKGVPPMYGIKDYFSQKVRTDTIFHPYFYKILEAVFYGNQLNEENILKAFMEKIVAAFKNVKENPNDFTRHVKTSFIIYQFFNELGLFNSTKMEEATKEFESVSLSLEEFVKQHNDYFTEEEPAKLGAFYVGCLTTKMLDVQKEYYKFQKPYQEPFLKYLQNINFNIEDLRYLIVKLNSFQKYQSNKNIKYQYQEIIDLQKEASSKLANSTNLSRTELSYSFTLGMAMQREFTKQSFRLYKEKETLEEDNQ